MKLATLNDGSRDGQLLVVSRDLAQAHFATGIATRLQAVLDDWNFLSPQLQDLSVTLNQGKARHAFAFDPRQCLAPLPRAHQWVLAPADLQPAAHAAGADAADTQFVQCASDAFLGPCQDARFADPAQGIQAGATLVVATGDVPLGASAEQGLDSVRLLLLANAWRLRAPGAGSLHGWPSAAFAPVAVTPDELGGAWQQGRLHLALRTSRAAHVLDEIDAASAMPLHFGQLIARLAASRQLRAGTLLGAGPLRQPGTAADNGNPATPPLLAVGDMLRLEVVGRDGHSVFGAIDQRVAGPEAAERVERAEAAQTPPA